MNLFLNDWADFANTASDAAACHKRHQAEIPPELFGVSLEYSESADGYGYHGNCIPICSGRILPISRYT